MFFFSVYLIVPTALGLVAHSASNRNEYQKYKNNVFVVQMAPVRRADKLTSVCEPVSRQCGILNISQIYRPPRPVTGMALYLRVHEHSPGRAVMTFCFRAILKLPFM
jgi:hypothetical protein